MYFAGVGNEVSRSHMFLSKNLSAKCRVLPGELFILLLVAHQNYF